MKGKVLVIILVMLMILSLTGCGEKSMNILREKVDAIIPSDLLAPTDGMASRDTTIIAEDKANANILADTEVSKGGIGMTLTDYMPDKSKFPRYFVYDPDKDMMTMLTTLNTAYILKSQFIVAYFGEEFELEPGFEVVIVPTCFGDTEEELDYFKMVAGINDSMIGDITTFTGDVKTFVKQYSNVVEVKKDFTNDFVVGKRVEEVIDLTAYYDILEELEATNDYYRELKDILPFEAYCGDYEGKIMHYSNEGDSSKSIIAGCIPGSLDSVMVVKMDGSDTYDVLVKIPYDLEDSGYWCTFKDLGNYRVIASDMTQEEVEEILNYDTVLKYEYIPLIYAAISTHAEGEILKDYVVKQGDEPVYFVMNPENRMYEVLMDDNRHYLKEPSLVYAYFGDFYDEFDELVMLEMDGLINAESMTCQELIEMFMEQEIAYISRHIGNSID